MRLPRRVCAELGAIVAVPTLAILVMSSRAQTAAAFSPEATVAGGDTTGAMFAAKVVIALFTIGVAMKVFDLKRNRSEEALALRVRAGEALRARRIGPVREAGRLSEHIAERIRVAQDDAESLELPSREGRHWPCCDQKRRRGE